MILICTKIERCVAVETSHISVCYTNVFTTFLIYQQSSYRLIAVVKIPHKNAKCLYPHPHSDRYQNLVTTSFLVTHRTNNFINIRRQPFEYAVDRQTDR